MRGAASMTDLYNQVTKYIARTKNTFFPDPDPDPDQVIQTIFSTFFF